MWISPDFFKTEMKPDGWIEDSNVARAVEWFTSFLTPQEWEKRRFSAFQNFMNTATGEKIEKSGKGRFFDERDRFAWYLLLAENWLKRPIFYDYSFGSRVIPIFISIGRNLDALKKVYGVDERVKRLVSQEKSQPNGCLFELLVAAAYLREGAQVSFLNETPGLAKTHDIDVLLNGITYAVECKRMETSEYTETERATARNLWNPLATGFEKLKMSVRCDIRYTTDLKNIPNDYLIKKNKDWIKHGVNKKLTWKDEYSEGAISKLDLRPLQKALQSSEIALSGSTMHQFLLGEYRRNSSIIQNLFVHLADNPLYIKSCMRGSICNWSSVSQEAVDSKARDVLKRVSEGCAQLPDGKIGIVHVGIEAVEGDDVENARYEK